MKKLEIDIEELVNIMDVGGMDRIGKYLNKETGEIIFYQDEYDIYMDDEEFEELQDWEKKQVILAREIDNDSDEKYISIPTIDSHEGYSIMEDFIRTVKDKNLVEKLEIAIDGRGAFRRFKDVLHRYEEERQRWFKYEDMRKRQIAVSWLADEDIEAIDVSGRFLKSE